MPTTCSTFYQLLFLGLCRSNLSVSSALNDQHDARTLHTRDISVASASSFIIVVAVGFIGILLICAGSSTWYRRRLARRHVLPDRATTRGLAPRPQLWDVYLPDLQGSPDLRDSADWDRVLVSVALSMDRLTAPLSTLDLTLEPSLWR
ncbi:uncharacterized protein PHACADRAFT_251360 [Phanerochaete carnosa HHB-10118-sp]|uniref:Uncharacterized protein n=1 Tax=Phanerochaete carnosa (strain HHB-10118-sp) TaxID=650164 RepID=K5W198_PHACS|nr:uncharacterized protein PHACADRAFT_251360 [Phanerochaete carnosa HHB-10118-sp]EKM57628.1 hypothetical protein PHACADRAFT_251360 [Phanerochaete carnosa HHB-10118-sp]